MTPREIEDRLRGTVWPAPSPGLRGRVLAEAEARAAELPTVRHVNWAPTGPGAPPKRPWRMAPALVAIAALIVVGACAGFDLLAGRNLNAEIARLEAKYGSLDVATLLAPAVPAADNRAHVIRAAAALAVPRTGVKFHYISLPVPSPLPADLRAFAEANRPAISLARDSRTKRQSNWQVGADYQNGSNAPHWESMRILSDAIHIAALLDIEEGRPDDAARTIVSGLAISASIRREPDGWDRFLNTSKHLETTRHLLTTSAPSTTALQELAGWLADNRTPDLTRTSMLAEMKRTNATFMRMEHGDIDPDTASWVWPSAYRATSSSTFIGIVAQIGRPLVRTARMRYLQHMERLLDAQVGPRPRAAMSEPESPKPWALIDRLVDKFTGGTWGESDRGDNFASELGATELAVALRRYKLDHGAYPDDLSALAPAYLDAIPIDPYTGRPAVYARQGEGFTLRAQNSYRQAVKWWAHEWNVEK